MERLVGAAAKSSERHADILSAATSEMLELDYRSETTSGAQRSGTSSRCTCIGDACPVVIALIPSMTTGYHLQPSGLLSRACSEKCGSCSSRSRTHRWHCKIVSEATAVFPACSYFRTSSTGPETFGFEGCCGQGCPRAVFVLDLKPISNSLALGMSSGRHVPSDGAALQKKPQWLRESICPPNC